MYSHLIGKEVTIEYYKHTQTGTVMSFNEFDITILGKGKVKYMNKRGESVYKWIENNSIYIIPIRTIEHIEIIKKEWEKDIKKVVKPILEEKPKPIKRKKTFFDLNFIEIMDITTEEERKNLTGDQRQHKENERLKFFGEGWVENKKSKK